MILTDTNIKRAIKFGDIEIKPYNPKQLGTNSYDLLISKHLAVYTDTELDAKKDNPIMRMEIPEEGALLFPGELYLGSTIEYTRSKSYMPYISGKSSAGRLGISIHVTAGEGDIGFKGHWTLEITVVKAVRVYAGMPIAQILFMLPLDAPEVPYSLKPNAKYHGQSHLPMPSQMFKNFQKETV